MMKKLWVCLMLLVCLTCAASAENVKIRTHDKWVTAPMTNNDYATRVSLPAGEELEIWTPEPCHGIQLYFAAENAHAMVLDENGAVLAGYQGRYRVSFLDFSAPATHFFVKAMVAMEISEIRFSYTPEHPAFAQNWRDVDGDAEMLVIATHPDDELLWFGGLLPTYAGQQGKKVVAAYMVGGHNPRRCCELLDGLWTCGVRDYPDIGCFPDMGGHTEGSTFQAWGGEDAVEQYIVRLIRKYRPQVLVTQDEKGEYGHNHHIVTVHAVEQAILLSGDADYDEESVRTWGAYTPQKVYLHLYPDNPVICDWEQPLSEFDGKTGVQVARLAFKQHISQDKGKYHVSVKGALDCRRFGLYYTSVGADTVKNDLFENIP